VISMTSFRDALVIYTDGLTEAQNLQDEYYGDARFGAAISATPAVDYIRHLLPEVQADFQRFSYPSGHAGAAILAYSSLVALAWPHAAWRWPMLVVALLVVATTGFGRVYMGVHWPTDVLAGYLLGGCWLGIGLTLKRRANS
jgi:membrane-associated phospholipid phosphatase